MSNPQSDGKINSKIPKFAPYFALLLFLTDLILLFAGEQTRCSSDGVERQNSKKYHPETSEQLYPLAAYFGVIAVSGVTREWCGGRGENQRQRCNLISRPHRPSPPSVPCPSLLGGSSARPRPRSPFVRHSQARANFRARALGGFSCLGAEPARGEGEVTERGQQQQRRGTRVRCVNKLDGGSIIAEQNGWTRK